MEDKTLTVAQIKPGDVLVRENDHLARPNHKVTVTRVEVHGKGWREWHLTGYFRQTERPQSLCAQGYRIVERNGQRIGTFFTKYW